MRRIAALALLCAWRWHEARCDDEGDDYDQSCGVPALLAERGGVRLYSIANFLSDDNCIALLNGRRRFMQSVESLTPLVCFQDVRTMNWYGVQQWELEEGTMCINSTLSAQLLGPEPPSGNVITYSTALSFYPGSGNPIGSVLSSRIKSIGPMLPFGEVLGESRGGKYQVTHYESGQGYAPHTDCVLGGTDKRDRAATVLVYLEDVEEGGETVFPVLGVSFKPRRGTALIFNGMDAVGNCLNASMHEARSVMGDGETKAILQRWYYFEPSPSLGKRITPPELPKRKIGQAKVQCDEVGANFCRLYDEWGHDHLIAYRRNFGMTRGLPVPTLAERAAATAREEAKLNEEGDGSSNIAPKPKKRKKFKKSPLRDA